jgi:hypothetical protein
MYALCSFVAVVAVGGSVYTLFKGFRLASLGCTQILLSICAACASDSLLTPLRQEAMYRVACTLGLHRRIPPQPMQYRRFCTSDGAAVCLDCFSLFRTAPVVGSLQVLQAVRK